MQENVYAACRGYVVDLADKSRGDHGGVKPRGKKSSGFPPGSWLERQRSQSVT
jgi:hypothetical protein